MNSIKNTEKTYGFLWSKTERDLVLDNWHFNAMQEVVNEPLVRGSLGIDVGSGCGYDTYIMAKNNPCVNIVSIDISDGVYKTKELTHKLKNVWIIKCSVLNTPLKDNIFDFAYSFGMLHHTTNPKRGLLEITRILKKNRPIFLYLYEDHSESSLKYIAVKIIAKLRNITIKIPQRTLYVLSYLSSPFLFMIFSFPSKILRKFKITQDLAKKMPFNFGTGPFSLRDDIFDRLSVPIEHRFSRNEVYDLFTECGLYNINITRLNGSAGWIVWGYKK